MKDPHDLTTEDLFATLGIPMPVPEEKVRPPWANYNFSYRFTGEVPLSVYLRRGDLK